MSEETAASSADARLTELVARGVILRGNPGEIFLDPALPLDAIAPGAVLERARLYGDCRVGAGAVLHDATLRDSRIGPRCRLGRGGPATLDRVLFGADVELTAGMVAESVVLSGAVLGFGSCLRRNVLIDTGATLGQSNDLKNTILGAATLLGSSTNFCDITALGGRPGRPVDQTEVGSGVIHFNFGIHGKKWGSWIGSIGSLFLRSPRSFIGGNTSLIGPVIVPDGTVSLVGSQLREPLERHHEGQELINAPGPGAFRKAFEPIVYGPLAPRLRASCEIIGRLRALDAWFRVVRARLGEPAETCDGARAIIGKIIAERVEWLDRLMDELPDSIARLQRLPSPRYEARARSQQTFLDDWRRTNRASRLRDLACQDSTRVLELDFTECLERALAKRPSAGESGDAPPESAASALFSQLAALPKETVKAGCRWLEAIASESVEGLPGSEQ